jgi:hypothetical protein
MLAHFHQRSRRSETEPFVRFHCVSARQQANSSSTPGFLSIVGAMPRWVTESDWKLSRSPAQTAFQIAFKTPLQLFSWLAQNPQALIPLAGHLQVSISVGVTQRSPEFYRSRFSVTCLRPVLWQTTRGNNWKHPSSLIAEGERAV